MFDQEQLLAASKWELAADLVADEGFRQSTKALTRAAALRMSRTTLGDARIETDDEEFVRSHTYAWAEFVTNLGHWQRIDMDLQLPRSERVFIAGWHFPELPKVFSSLRRIRALLLVSQDAPWFQPFKQHGQTLDIFSKNASNILTGSMKSGAIVAAVLDHHHVNTRHEISTLLGRSVKTPSGILELCARFDYLLAFVGPRDDAVKVVQQIDTRGLSAAYLAQQYNRWLEAEIRRAPERWLMWQALPVGLASAESREVS